MNWEEMTPEQKDALVAEKVMEWRPTLCEATEKDIFYAAESAEKVRIHCSKCGYQDREGIIYRGKIYWVHSVPQPRYTQGMDAAWLVVEKMSEIPTKPWIGELPPNTWFMHYFEKASLWACSAEEAAEEICKAALQALGVDVK